MKICFDCKFHKEIEKGWTCKEDIRNMEMDCLIRRMIAMVGNISGPSPLKNKAEKMMDKLDKEIDAGEEWKQ